MCLIAVADKQPLSRRLVEDAHDANPHGMGVAWIDGNLVRWVKGIQDTAELGVILDQLELPYVVHFRLCSSGPNTPEMTHPFPLNGKASLALSGATPKGVLFHNGHWSRWDDTMLRNLPLRPRDLPAGPWSDTRAIAWITARWGKGIISMIDGSQKIAILTPKGVETFGSPWIKKDGQSLSNENHEYAAWYGGGTNGNVYKSVPTSPATVGLGSTAPRLKSIHDMNDREWADFCFRNA